MRKTIYTILLLFFALSVSAGQRTKEQAQSIAQKLAERIGTVVESDVAASAKAKHKAASTATETDAYYIFNTGNDNGFVIVSGEDKLPAIIGYTDKGSFDAENMPVQLKEFLDSYTQLVGSVEDGNVTLDSSITDDNGNSLTSITPVTPLLAKNTNGSEILWNQGDPYNLQCPEINGERAVTGCGPTAVAQVMRYWKYPTALTKTIPVYSTYAAIVPSSTAEDNIYDWENMLPQYSSSATDNQKNAVAKLMMHLGHVMQASYGVKGTSVDDATLFSALQFYGYDSSLLQLIKKSSYTYSEWKTMLTNEMEHNRPVLYGGQSSGGGHAFVIDGIDESGLYHVNWGWSGSDNGYFDITILNPNDNSGIGASTSDDGYSGGALAVVGITSANTDSEKQYQAGTSPETTTSKLALTIKDKDGTNTLYCNSHFDFINKLTITATNNSDKEFYSSDMIKLNNSTNLGRLNIYLEAGKTKTFTFDCTIDSTNTATTCTLTAFSKEFSFDISKSTDRPSLTITSITSTASETNLTPIDFTKISDTPVLLLPTLKSNSITYSITFNNTGSYYRGKDIYVGYLNTATGYFNAKITPIELPSGVTTLNYTDNNLTIGDYTGVLVWVNDRITLNKTQTQILNKPNNAGGLGFNNCYYAYVAGPAKNVNVSSANLASNDNAYYSSLYLDYAVQMPEGVSAYTATIDKANNKVNLNKIEDGIVPANTGVILRMTTATNYELTATSTTKQVASDLQGRLADTPVSEISSTPYVLSIYNGSPAFQQYSGTTLRANKAYLILPSSAKSFKFDFADEEVDGIKSLTPTLSNREGVVYNLNGQRVNKGSKGIVIVNGKKYINK